MLLLFVFLVCSFFCASDSTTHDVPMAIFKFEQKEDYITFRAKLIREDLEAVLPKIEEVQKEDVIKNYVQERIRMRIDGRFVSLLLESVEEGEHFFLLSGRLGNVVQNWAKIEFWNSCLVDEIEGHSNIIHFHFYEDERSYRMTTKRRQIFVEY